MRSSHAYLTFHAYLPLPPFCTSCLPLSSADSQRVVAAFPHNSANVLGCHISSSQWRHRFLQYCCWCSARGYITPISIHNLPSVCTSNIDRYDERKWFYATKDKKQMITHTNYHGNRQHRWYSTSCKYTYLKQIPAAKSRAGSRWHWPFCECRQNRDISTKS